MFSLPANKGQIIMARLYLVRHAQASFGMEDYDQLSELGINQSTHLPRHFDKNPSTIYRGNMLRHQQTLENSFGSEAAIVLPGLNEFDHKNVLEVHRPEIANRDAAFALVASQKDPKKFLEDEFEIAMLKWIKGENNHAYNETYTSFKKRTTEALQDIIAKARADKHKDILVITSGGVISLLVAQILGLSDEKMIGLNLHIANTSVTTLLFNDHKTSLRYFNNYSHLPAEMVTFI
jgi:broad specificity phosphatase PhoE